LRPVSFIEKWGYSHTDIIAEKIGSPFSLDTALQQISVGDIGRYGFL